MAWGIDTKVIAQLAIDVRERGRHANTMAHRETQTMCLAGPVIWILTQDDDAGFGVGREVEGGEYLIVWRIDRMRRPFVGDERHEIIPVGLSELLSQEGIPVGHHVW